MIEQKPTKPCGGCDGTGLRCSRCWRPPTRKDWRDKYLGNLKREVCLRGTCDFVEGGIALDPCYHCDGAGRVRVTDSDLESQGQQTLGII